MQHTPMMRKTAAALIAGVALAVVTTVHAESPSPGDSPNSGESLRDGFRDPPDAARPMTYMMLLNGYVNRDYAEKELRQYRDAGIAGLCLFDLGARGRVDARPPAGPPFMSDESVGDLSHIIRTAGDLGMRVQLSVASSWDMGGSWVEPRHASMGLYHTETSVQGSKRYDDVLPFPRTPDKAPQGADGKPAFWEDVAVLAIPEPQRVPGHDFVFELDPAGVHTLDRIVLHNVAAGEVAAGERIDGDAEALPAKEFTVAVSMRPPGEGDFETILEDTLEAKAGPQRFDVQPVDAAYVRLRIRSGHRDDAERVQLAEFAVVSKEGINVVASHEADRARDGAKLLRASSSLGDQRVWSASNLHDGETAGAAGVWSSAGPPPLLIEDREAIINLTDRVGQDGRLRWDVPEGRWLIQRFVCSNTGERLKVPSPNSDGLATDHFNAEATEHYLGFLAERMQSELGDLGQSPLDRFYLASFEVKGATWTPDFLEQFRGYRGYDMTRFLPVLSGAVVDSRQVTERFRHDFRKTLGDLLVDAYYRAAEQAAGRVGLGVEAEAGGPGPPIHQVPVDALEAQGAIEGMRGEFWPHRPDADGLWVVKETAAAAHIYGHRKVHMESFTSMYHWQDGPLDLKPSADRAMCEGTNHFVWHTSSHLPPEAGKPGWVYGAGTHLNPNLAWWPMAPAFVDYLSRSSYLLQQGLFVGDVCYYYGDKGFNFVPPKHIDPSLGYGYDYDVTNKEVILNRMETENGRVTLPDGMSYELLVLPERKRVDLEVLKKIEKLVAAGATVVGPKPEDASGLAGYPQRSEQVRRLAEKLWGKADGEEVTEHVYGDGKVIWGRPLREILNERGIGPDFDWRGPGEKTEVDYIHRRTDKMDIYFVRNKTDRTKRGDAVFRVNGRAPEIWDSATGEVQRQHVYRAAAGEVEVPLELPPHGSTFVVFRRPAEAAHVASLQTPAGDDASTEDALLPSPRVLGSDRNGARLRVFRPGTYAIENVHGRRASVEVASSSVPAPKRLSGPWPVHFQSERGAPEAVELPRLTSWTDHEHQGVRFFAGIAQYEKQFDLPAGWLDAGREVHLDLGDLWAVGRVKLNGRDQGVLWKPPYRLNVTDALREGSNRLVVEIANTWSNRLAGDARTDGQDFGRTNVTHTHGKAWKEVDLIPSGLFGPVRLLPAATVEATYDAEK